jgi:hypothetical protein
MDEIDEYRRELLSGLVDVADELSRTVAAIPAGAWHTSVDPDSLTRHYVLAHLHALESQVFAAQLHRVVEENVPLIPLFDAQAWMAGHYTSSKPAQAILDEFSQLRGREVAWLQELPVESWSRTARHPWWGLRALQWFVELQLEYSLQHVRELTTSHPS